MAKMIAMPSQHVTRLAPSPTGALHLGNARTFLVNWALARRHGWKVVLRIEDLDSPRTKVGADQQAIADLRWLGIDWDEGPTWQLPDLTRYHEALAQLSAAGLIYPCRCTRSQITAAQSAPHGDEHDLRYPGTCRPTAPPPTWRPGDTDPAVAWRLVVDDAEINFTDACAGPQRHNVQQTVGDFIVAAKNGLPAYQLAVVVDDARQGVTQVVRGDDLLTSTPRQILLYRMLGLGPLPTYTHLPLVLGEDGHRLAKRHGDTRIATYRELGVAPQRVVGLLASWSGIAGRKEMSAAEFADIFHIDHLPPQPAVLSGDDEAWLGQATASQEH
jgi:glutamyl-tRNA synthetase